MNGRSIRDKLRRRKEQPFLDHAVETYKGITLCDLRLITTSDAFVLRTKDALELVEFFDPRRFRRIQQYIRYIANKEMTSAGGYDERTKVCYVDLTHFRFSDDLFYYRLMYASLFVHEATHGLVESKGIRYNRWTRLRIERLCHEEERRFLRRASPWPVDEVLGELDEGWLRQYWGFWSNLRMEWARTKELIRKLVEQEKG